MATHTGGLLSVENLSWQVTDKSILEQLTFAVEQGEFVGIIGPNGAGKSSLLRCLYGQIKDFLGDIQINDKPIVDYTSRQLAQTLAVVLQEPQAYIELRVIDVIRMGLTPHKALLSFDDEKDEQAILAAAKQVDLFDKLQQSFNTLSGGEKQRAMIARAIVQRPTILLMDEPTNHLDIRHQFDVLQLAKSLGVTVIVSIHDLNLAAAFCERLILLDNGRMVAEGTPNEVLTQNHLQNVFSVSATVDNHPQRQQVRITYDFPELTHE